jgi:hypothetical protein
MDRLRESHPAEACALYEAVASELIKKLMVSTMT